MTEPTKTPDPHRSAYSAATTRLRDQYRDEFNKLMTEEMAARGAQWSPRLSEEQKAEQQIAELLGKFPDLAVKFVVAD